MASLKNIVDLPVAESAEGLKFIVSEDGTAKQIAAGVICKVKTVNGVEPDGAGNVEIEIPEGFSGSWNDLKDKPFYREVETKVAVERQTAEFKSDGDWGDVFPIALPADIYDSKEVDILWDGVVYRIDGADLKNHDFDGPIGGDGLSIFYIREIGGQVYFTTFGEHPTEIGITYTCETVHKLDAKYLPDDVGGGKVYRFIAIINRYVDPPEVHLISGDFEEWDEHSAQYEATEFVDIGNAQVLPFVGYDDNGELHFQRTWVNFDDGKSLEGIEVIVGWDGVNCRKLFVSSGSPS